MRDSLEDPSQFQGIFERHYDAVRRYAQGRIGFDAGEEVAAETFLIALSRRASFDPRYPSARPWLLGIATNLIRHHVRSERTRYHALARLAYDEVEEPVDLDALDAARIAPMVIEALAAMSLAHREAFLLRSISEMTYEEIAAALDIPVGTVRSRIFHARRALREREELFEAIKGWTDG